MPRKRRKYKHPDRYRGGQVVVNRLDYTRHDYISPGRLVAWAEWIPIVRPRNRKGKEGMISR